MKTAQELFDDLVRNIRLPVGHSISLCEVGPRAEEGQNWTIAIGNVPPDVQSRYEQVRDEMKKLHRIIDWSAVKVASGERRCISGSKVV